MMSTSIAFLSGKGGSGKTTLALSMADLLCSCGIRTLLVDSDLSTNGATYFYEARLSEQVSNVQNKVVSFKDILASRFHNHKFSILSIKPNLDFIPSIPEISDLYLTDEILYHNINVATQLQNFLSSVDNRYDVILFDCQAGYTNLLPSLLPLMDIDLFVLEADSISASAMRSLHLKIGNILGHARLYQVFNKATPEEFEIYSKIVGTFFTNIGTLLFDWKIRQAFSRSQVPDLENTSAKYGLDLCDICSIMLPDKQITKKLNTLSTKLHCQQLEEKRQQIENEMLKRETKSHSFTKTYLIAILGTLFSAVASLLTFKSKVSTHFLDMSFVSVGLVSILLMIIITSTDILRDHRNTRHMYERELKNLTREIDKLRQTNHTFSDS